MSKLEKMQRFVPSVYRPKDNPMVRGLLTAWSEEDDRISTQRQNAKEQVFVKFARQRFLNALGSNVGVFRPAAINLSDDQFRNLIPALSWFPKQVEPTIQAVLDVFFNPGNPIVDIAQVNPNEIVITIPSSVPALRRDLRGANHFKTYDGNILSIDNVFKEMVVEIDGTFTSAEPSHLVFDQNTTLFTDASTSNDLFAFELDSTGSGFLDSISLAFNRAGALPISGAFKLEIRADDSGEPSVDVLAETAEISIPDLPQNPDGNLVPYVFETPAEFEDGETYWVVINLTENLSAGSFLALEDDSSLGYSGLWLNSTNGGTTWVAGGGSSTFVNQLAQTAAFVFFDNGNSIGDKKAQQFTANSTGDVSAVKVGLINNGSTTGQIKLSIQADNGSNNPDGVDLASTNIDFTSFIGGPTIDLYSFTGTASVVSGQKYWIVFDLVTVPNNSSNLRYSSGNPLPEFYAFNTGSWTLNGSVDITFEVEIVQPPAGPTLSPYFDTSISASIPGDKILKENEWADAKFGQGLNVQEIIGNTPGPGPITVQFSAGVDLSVFNTIDKYRVANATSYQGAFIPDPTRPYSVTQQRGVLGQELLTGNIYPVVQMQDASGIPDAPGFVTFNFGGNQEEGPIKYFGRPNNSTLLLDPSYNFTKDHSIGEAVNVVVTPYREPRVSGFDYATYLVGVTAARELAQQIVESVTASGVVVRWIIVEPVCEK